MWALCLPLFCASALNLDTYIFALCLLRLLFFCLVCQASDDEMKKKNNMISRLEEKTNQITATMKQLEQR